MTEKRFTYEYDEYNGNLFDNKMNTFYHIEDSDENIKILCDRLNWLVEENEQLKQDNTGLMQLLKNQSIIIQELHSKLLEYQLKEPINLTKEDLEIMGKAISYYTLGRNIE